MSSPTATQVVRSYLFVPGNRPERFAKAMASGADALILDLEDSVPLGEKAAAREAVIDWLKTPHGATQQWVRVNPQGGAFHADDLRLLLRARPHGLVLPKCEGLEDLQRFDTALLHHEHSVGWAPHSVRVLAIATETARAMQRIHSFDQPHPRLDALMWGAEDLATSLGVRGLRDAQGRFRGPALRARDAALFAAHACGVQAVDTVYTALDDAAGLHAETREHAALGFTSRAAIHPAQIATIHEALRPAEDDIAWAQEVIAELQDGKKSSGRVRGGMVDQPHLVAARRILLLRG